MKKRRRMRKKTKTRRRKTLQSQWHRQEAALQRCFHGRRASKLKVERIPLSQHSQGGQKARIRFLTVHDLLVHQDRTNGKAVTQGLGHSQNVWGDASMLVSPQLPRSAHSTLHKERERDCQQRDLTFLCFLFHTHKPESRQRSEWRPSLCTNA